MEISVLEYDDCERFLIETCMYLIQMYLVYEICFLLDIRQIVIELSQTLRNDHHILWQHHE